MTTNDPLLEVLLEIRDEIRLIATELRRLVLLVEYRNARLDEHIAAMDELHASMRAVVSSRPRPP